MDYEIHESGWGVTCHTPIKELQRNDIILLLELLMKNTIITWRNQNLTPREISNFCNYIGNHDYAFSQDQYDKFSNEVKSSFVENYSGLIRVSGKTDSHKNEGVFGHSEELNWHSDKIHDITRKPFTFLYSSEGSAGSVTEFTNHIVAYSLLDEDKKELYQNLKIKFGSTRWRKDLNSSAYNKTLKYINSVEMVEHKLIVENPYGMRGIFISPLQTEHISGMSQKETLKFCDMILKHITQPKCVYKHNWQDGDVVISDQIFGIHKRNKFDNMHKRELHRMSFDLSNIMSKNIEYIGYKGKIV